MVFNEQEIYSQIATSLGISSENAVVVVAAIVVVLLVWKLIWYGFALYNTIQRKQKTWFVVLFICSFVLGDLGILAIIYLILNKEPKNKEIKEPEKSLKKKK
jgi:RsiW-degrading membrane proteinase PrsW (M82 family)